MEILDLLLGTLLLCALVGLAIEFIREVYFR